MITHTDPSHNGTIPHLELDDRNVTSLLKAMHRLLLAHKYDYALDEALRQLVPHLPGVDGYYDRLNGGQLPESAVPPSAAAALDDLLAVMATHVQEAMLVGYLLGSLHTRITVYASPHQVAMQMVRSLGLEEAMEVNLGFGFQLTDAGRAQLEKPQ